MTDGMCCSHLTITLTLTLTITLTLHDIVTLGTGLQAKVKGAIVNMEWVYRFVHTNT